ncbi:MAG: ferredoxin [Bacteroidetes bacterium]|jgi:ferredoxin|nr:ferredoxin [Bacteroidota bacterium]
MLRITQLRAKCIGCHACVEAAPHRWRMDRTDGKSTLIGASQKNGYCRIVVGLDELEANQQAAKNCPVHIIRLEPCK